MQLTKYTDLSLRVMMHLALEPDELGTIKDIAERYRVSRNHLVKVVHQLVNLGYLKSVQGRGGGITLAKPAAKINVGKVVRQMENTLDVIDCAAANCPLTPSCILKCALNEATKSFLQVLDNYTVADLVKNRTQLLRLID
ncbi:MAG: Rrf2 family transcriptional regulator [Pseudomonadales bacterium]